MRNTKRIQGIAREPAAMQETKALRKHRTKQHVGQLPGDFRAPSFMKRGIAFIVIFVLIIIGINLSFLFATTRVFHPAVCTGDWKLVSNAQGEPELEASDSIEAFNETNSAVFNQETGTQISCGDFQGEWPENLVVRNAKLRLSLVASFSSQSQEQSSGGGQASPSLAEDVPLASPEPAEEPAVPSDDTVEPEGQAAPPSPDPPASEAGATE